MQVKRGTQASDASMITAYGTPYLTIGGLENRVNSLQTIGFGYNSFGGTIRYTPAEIGFLTTSVAGNTLGDIVFATRSVTTNTAASEVVRITSTGAVGIGTIAPKAKLEVSGGDAIIYGVSVGRGSGAITTNTAIGSGALRSNTTGNFNTANGLYALRSNTTGAANTANGVNALLSNTTGISNTANGVSALFSNTTGNYNTANGQAALISNTTGNYNTANGMNALQANTTG